MKKNILSDLQGAWDTFRQWVCTTKRSRMRFNTNTDIHERAETDVRS
jgi:hypothetical protein